MLTRPSIALAAPAFTDHVLPQLARWRQAGRGAALITLVGVEGGGPRPLGAQMAVAEGGDWIGYISGGCLEGAIVAEALAALEEQQGRLLRYGAGSPFFDIRLPCGSGLDVYIDPSLADDALADLTAAGSARQPAALITDMVTGISQALAGSHATTREGDRFIRGYAPALRLVAFGAGPMIEALAQLCAPLGLGLNIATPDSGTAQRLREGGHTVIHLSRPGDAAGLLIDAHTAAVLLFHDHDFELPILRQLIASPAFFIAAVGSARAHAARLAGLAAAGVPATQSARIRGEAGLIPRARNPAIIAYSILGEVLARGAKNGIAP